MNNPFPSKRTLWGIIIFLALASLCFGIWQFGKTTRERRINVSPEVGLEMVALLTKQQPSYPSDSKWKEALLKKLPEFVVKKIPSKWIYNPNPHIKWSLTRDRVLVLIKFNVPERWYGQYTLLQIRSRIEDSLKRAGINEIYLTFPGGYESEKRSIYVTHIPKWGKNGTYMLEGLAFQIPPNVDRFDVTFASSSRVRSAQYKRRYIPFRNPVKGYTAPIAASATPLPASLTHDGVTVTLRSLESQPHKTAHSSRTGKSPGAESTAETSPETVAVFDIADSETSPSQWAINDPVKVRFGNPDIEFETDSTIYGRPPQQTARFAVDFGVLDQPVQLTVPLIRVSNFPADEQVVRSFPLPATGTHTEILKLWDGPVTVFAGNKVSFTGSRSTIPSNAFSIMVSSERVQNHDIRTELRRIELTPPGKDAINLMPFMESQTFLTHWHITDFSLERLMNTHSRTEADLEDSTVSVTVIRPREFSHKFQFIVQPGRALQE